MVRGQGWVRDSRVNAVRGESEQFTRSLTIFKGAIKFNLNVQVGLIKELMYRWKHTVINCFVER